MNRITVRQESSHELANGSRPPNGFTNWKAFAESIPLFDIVDQEALYFPDREVGMKPFHITLPIAEVGQFGSDGFTYDKKTVDTIQQQLPGLGGRRGHVKDEERGYDFQRDTIHWVGSKRVRGTLYAKGYIAPGQDREEIRGRMARGGEVRTSIYGTGVRIDNEDGTYQVDPLELEAVDLGAPTMVAYRGDDPVVTTSQFDDGDIDKKDKPMPAITIQDVPESVQAQILQNHAQGLAATRVPELEEANDLLTSQLTVAQKDVQQMEGIRHAMPDAENIPAEVTQMQSALKTVRELFGDDLVAANATMRQMHTRIATLETEQFAAEVETAVQAMTDWQVNGDDAKQQIQSFRAILTKATLAQMNGNRDSSAIKEAAEAVWSEYEVIAEGLRDKLSGPPGTVGGKGKPADWRESVGTPEYREGIKEKFGI